MRTALPGMIALALLALSAPAAQGQVQLGPQISVADEVDLGVGATVVFPLSSIYENLEFSGDFTLYFPDGYDYWEADGNVRLLFPLSGSTSLLPFVMAGLSIGRFSWDAGGPFDGSETELGLRLGGGFKVPMERFTPFMDLGLGIGDIPDFTLRGGVTFAVGN